jgi:hypothetical protein
LAGLSKADGSLTEGDDGDAEAARAGASLAPKD